MALRITNLTLNVDDAESLLIERAAERLGLEVQAITRLQIARRSIDARHQRVHFVYTVDVETADPADESAAIRNGRAVESKVPAPVTSTPGHEEIRGDVVIVGCGPAGLFAGLKLAEYGYRPLLLERGAPIDQRHGDVKSFLNERALNPDSNLLFGAGGAGTYSDGKLRTRIRDARIREVLEHFVSAGAPADLLTNARPHIGTDLLHNVISMLCDKLIALGGRIRWRTRVTGIETAHDTLSGLSISNESVETNCAILATGASARDTFADMLACGLAIAPKPFQMGVRIEHPRELIDRAIYGALAGHPRLGAAEYVFSARSATAFCVCPGGVLMAACAEPGTVCTNGMSAHARDGEFTNTALVTTVKPAEFGQEPLSGIDYQRQWERKAFQLAGGDYTAPGQNARDFLSGTTAPLSRRTSYPFDVRPLNMRKVLPPSVSDLIAGALAESERRIQGYAGSGAILVGPETRASCAVRLPRDRDKRTSVNADGLYPAGEGAGYAGGIMSSAIDGIKSAETIISRFAQPSC